MTKDQQSLIDEANEAIRKFERRVKDRRRWDRIDKFATIFYWCVIACSVWTFYLGFKWKLFQYITGQWWQHFAQWALS